MAPILEEDGPKRSQVEYLYSISTADSGCRDQSIMVEHLGCPMGTSERNYVLDWGFFGNLME